MVLVECLGLFVSHDNSEYLILYNKYSHHNISLYNDIRVIYYYYKFCFHFLS